MKQHPAFAVHQTRGQGPPAKLTDVNQSKPGPDTPSPPQLWIMPAFGGRPHFSNKVEVGFYGYSLWAAIVNICLPFCIFYRMHAVSSLLEVYVLS